MAKFNVRCTSTIYVTREAEFEAETLDEAIEKAKQRYQEADWEPAAENVLEHEYEGI